MNNAMMEMRIMLMHVQINGHCHSLPMVYYNSFVHASALFSFPSSHCSLDCVISSPQNSTTHCALQPSLLTLLPSSHCSFDCCTLSPQNSIIHCALHPSLLFEFPSSHCSV